MQLCTLKQISCVHNFVKNEAFKQTIKTSSLREQIMGASLARYFDCDLHLNNDPQKLKHWDYVLYSVSKGWLKTCEQQDDYFISSDQDTLCFELLTHIDKETSKEGKLNYTKSDRLIYIINKLELALLLSVSKIRQLCVAYEDAGILQTTTPRDFDEWQKKHDSLPTTCALLPMQEVLLNDPKARVISFHELNIPNNYQSIH